MKYRPASEPLIRRLVPDEMPAYKALRDQTLADNPEAFTSDAATERRKEPASYLPRLGSGGSDGGHFTLGAWLGETTAMQLVGAISCEREPRIKVRHTGHITGMMVKSGCSGQGIGRALLIAAIAEAHSADGLEMLTLSVTASNLVAIRLYESLGFVRYGRLPGAIKVEGRYHTKDQMVLML
ncbi:GNAT family N-acetyltransferase [soil metagenome]